MLGGPEDTTPGRPVLEYVGAGQEEGEALIPVRPSEHADVGALSWSRGGDPRLYASALALALDRVDGAPVLLRASFTAPDAKVPIGNGAFSVRSIRVRAHAVVGDSVVEGVEATLVALSGEHTLRLRVNNATGIGRHPLVLRWEFASSAGDDWEVFAFSHHVVYFLFSTPRQPWDAGINPPWQTCLDWACTWAADARTPTEAAGRIVAALYRLGGTSSGASGTIQYEMTGSSNYTTATKFELGAFLDLLEGRPQRGYKLNCSDCAAVVSTFANALGCDLDQVKLIPSTRYLESNMLWLIGRAEPESFSGENEFTMHEVAWAGPIDANGSVYDACLMLDAGPDPTSVAYGKVWENIAGLLFGQADQPLASSGFGYLNRMLKSGARAVILKPIGRRSV
jgi:hypothetical protein